MEPFHELPSYVITLSTDVAAVEMAAVSSPILCPIVKDFVAVPEALATCRSLDL
ncbi:MAG: hypothetical protein J5693_00025 [Bacteroidales bacterium]|nr:hypothetical protein [Bacteroidales bacterium]